MKFYLFHLQELRANFDRGSLRILRLLAMRAEMLEDYETALGILDKILEEDEANSQVHRNSIRLVEMIKWNN